MPLTCLQRPSSDSLLSVWLQDAKGFVFEFCRDQHGSRFIQERLAKASAEEVLALYSEVQPRMLSLMTDVFGNYVIQKFLEHGNQVGLFEQSCLAVGHPLEQPCASALGLPTVVRQSSGVGCLADADKAGSRANQDSSACTGSGLPMAIGSLAQSGAV